MVSALAQSGLGLNKRVLTKTGLGCRKRTPDRRVTRAVEWRVIRCTAASADDPMFKNRSPTYATNVVIQPASLQAGASASSSNGTEPDLFTYIRTLPYSRIAIWSGILLLAYKLKEFFGIAMGTFIIAFVGNSFVQSASNNRLLSRMQPDARRHLLVVVYYSAILSIFVLFGVMTIPDVVREGVDFVQRLQKENIWTTIVQKAYLGLGDGVMDNLERLLLLASSDDVLAHGIKELSVIHGSAWTDERFQILGQALSKLLAGYTNAAVQFTSSFLQFTTRFALQLGISMVLSFMFVWDLPSIIQGIDSLKSSRLSRVYDELVPPCSVFGRLFGKALQAQAQVAMVNTALTAAGMWCLQIPGIGLLSLFVFICSFIPIAGCIISTVPIGFVALTEYGFLRLAMVILMVFGVHMVEAYGLNPAIYSAHLKLHPLLVLSVIVIAEHSLGVWGLLLAVPLTVFALDYLIRYPAYTMTDVAREELDKSFVQDGFDSYYHAGYDADEELRRG